jgi:hypothetical protein
MELVFYEEKYKDKIINYELTDEQLRYTGHPVEWIHLSNMDPSRYSVLALEKGNLVTFFVLHKNEGVKPYSDNIHAIIKSVFHRFPIPRDGICEKSINVITSICESELQ